MLVPLIEEGEKDLAIQFIKKYLEPFKNKKLDALALGCTHYPFYKNEIRKILGPKISGEDLKRLEKDLEQVLKEKEGLSPMGKFTRWLDKVTGDPKAWLEKNEGTLRLRIEQAKKLKDLREVLESVLYYVFFFIIYYYTAIPAFSFTNNLLKSREIRKRDEDTNEVVNEHEVRIEDLEEAIEQIKKAYEISTVKNEILLDLLNDIISAIKDLKSKEDTGATAEELETQKKKAYSLVERIEGLGIKKIED
jgi:hypothetical protein